MERAVAIAGSPSDESSRTVQGEPDGVRYIFFVPRAYPRPPAFICGKEDGGHGPPCGCEARVTSYPARAYDAPARREEKNACTT